MERIALLYPHTYVREDLATLALAFFDRLVILQPSEKEPKAALTHLLEAGLVEIVTPPPFGERLPWFEQLVKSYEEWGQMMRWPENVSMFKAWPEALEESVAEIKAALVGKDISQEDPILKARVILQLAHDLDQRLEELDQEYKALHQQASQLAQFVLGQDLGENRFPNWVAEGQEPHWEMQGLKERLKAYAVLVPLLPALPSWVVTDQWAVVEELLDLAPEKVKRLGSLRIEPLAWEDIPQNILQKRRPWDSPEGQAKIQALLSGQIDEAQEGPRLEVWRIPYEIKSLLRALLDLQNIDLSLGETTLFYLAHF